MRIHPIHPNSVGLSILSNASVKRNKTAIKNINAARDIIVNLIYASRSSGSFTNNLRRSKLREKLYGAMKLSVLSVGTYLVHGI